MGLGALGLIIGFIFYGEQSYARVWSNLLINSYYFAGIGLAALFFIAAHQLGYSGWHTIFKRIPEAMSSVIPFVGIVIFVIALGNMFHWHHLYHWSDTFIQEEQVSVADLREYEAGMAHGDEHHEDDHAAPHHDDEHHAGGHHVAPPKPEIVIPEATLAEQAGYANIKAYKYAQLHQNRGHNLYAANYEDEAGEMMIANPHYDKVIAGKAPFLNGSFFIVRIAIYVLLWSLFSFLLKNISKKEDQIGEAATYQRSKYLAAAFIVVFAVTESTASWDLIMSIDTHWYSTLFGWYNFASYMVASVSMIALIVIYLKGKGYLQAANENHIHDLGKYMFGFSVFWTYLFFAQFLLIWYGNIPEATHYYHNRFDSTFYQAIFYVLFIINFATPFLVLMKRKSKRSFETISFVGVVLIIGHWLDFYLMVSPGSVGSELGAIGILEVLMFAGFLGLFLFATFNALTKASLVPVNNPYLKESMIHHT